MKVCRRIPIAFFFSFLLCKVMNKKSHRPTSYFNYESQLIVMILMDWRYEKIAFMKLILKKRLKYSAYIAKSLEI